MTGYVKIYRSLWDDTAFRKEPFSEREAWVWMVSEAAWKPHERRIGKYVVALERGQFSASVRHLGDVWGWQKSRVHRFLDRLSGRQMIAKNVERNPNATRDSSGTQPGTGILVITICKYDIYQDAEQLSGTVAGRKAGQKRDSSGTNKNKGKKEKKEYPQTPRGGLDDFEIAASRIRAGEAFDASYLRGWKRDELLRRELVTEDDLRRYA